MSDYEIRFMLDEGHFRDLVHGRIITLKHGKGIVRMALMDIGFDRMQNALDEAWDKGLKKDEPRGGLNE